MYVRLGTPLHRFLLVELPVKRVILSKPRVSWMLKHSQFFSDKRIPPMRPSVQLRLKNVQADVAHFGISSVRPLIAKLTNPAKWSCKENSRRA